MPLRVRVWHNIIQTQTYVTLFLFYNMRFQSNHSTQAIMQNTIHKYISMTNWTTLSLKLVPVRFQLIILSKRYFKDMNGTYRYGTVSSISMMISIDFNIYSTYRRYINWYSVECDPFMETYVVLYRTISILEYRTVL